MGTYSAVPKSEILTQVIGCDMISIEDGEATSLWAYVMWLAVWLSADACVTSSQTHLMRHRVMSWKQQVAHRPRMRFFVVFDVAFSPFLDRNGLEMIYLC